MNERLREGKGRKKIVVWGLKGSVWLAWDVCEGGRQKERKGDQKRSG